jgi:hypothetical protein
MHYNTHLVVVAGDEQFSFSSGSAFESHFIVAVSNVDDFLARKHRGIVADSQFGFSNLIYFFSFSFLTLNCN